MPDVTVEQAYAAALGHHRAGRTADAAALYRQILNVAPAHAEAMLGLGMILHTEGHLPEAERLLRRVMELRPQSMEGWNNLANLLRDAGKCEEAVAGYCSAIAIRPDAGIVHFNLGRTLFDLGRDDEAIAAYERAAALLPDYAEVFLNWGATLQRLGRAEEAIAKYQRAIALKPHLVAALNNLAVLLQACGRADEAAATAQRALAIQPNYAEAWNTLGMALHAAGKLEEAADAFSQAVRLGLTTAEGNLAGTLHDTGRAPGTAAPGHNAAARSNYLWMLHHSGNRTPEELFAEHVRIAALLGPADPFTFDNGREPARRLRIGYVSGDFRQHSVASFAEPLIADHDRAAFEVFCYSNVAAPDAATDRFRSACDHWRDISRLSDPQAIAMVRSDAIDLLVDLAGHTAGNRLGLFARRAAPVQVTYLGYPNTTGLAAMDYRITDALADPPGLTENLHTESLLRIPPPFLCYRPPAEAPDVPPPPIEHNGFVTFGSFNALPKVMPAVPLWSRLLQAIPSARLLLKNAALQDPAVCSRIRTLFENHGVSAPRLELLGPLRSAAEHLSLYARMDLSLDTFPYHGTTTTCEALWMGVPVVTLAGRSHVSRVGVSILQSISLQEWIAATEDEFIAIATALAHDPARLRRARSTMRDRMKASPLMDEAAFLRKMEAAYRRMWQSWCAHP